MVAATRASRASAATLRRGLAAAPPKLAAMKRPFDPRRADVAALATGHAHHAGSLGLSDLPRLREDEPPGFELQTSPIVWRIDAEARPVTGGEPQLRLHLQAHGSVWRECQRCLQPVAIALVVDRPLRFVRGEDAAAALDADNDEEDVLDLKPRIDLVELIEDELLMALPIVPRHETCPQPLPVGSGDAAPADVDADDAAPHPFAALAALKARRDD